MADDNVLYQVEGPIARVTMNRPDYGNAQNSAMTYALDDAFYRAASDDDVAVVVLAGAGRHFSAGHDIGTPGRDIDTSFERRAGLWCSPAPTSSTGTPPAAPAATPPGPGR